MLKNSFFITAALCAFVSFPAYAGHNSPCEAIMCLSTGGKSPKECSKSIKAYFNIEEKKHGSFSPSRTANKRKKEVNEKCPDANKSDVARIHAKYGSLHKSANPFQFY
jgi:hypothetical protein